ncbi:MAG: hypothetical protein DCC48_07225 [Acidobacteria bacterium]|nr:MAG: hypothetical protein DCC48_07225 [Acidobacteriota bacterium]
MRSSRSHQRIEAAWEQNTRAAYEEAAWAHDALAPAQTTAADAQNKLAEAERRVNNLTARLGRLSVESTHKQAGQAVDNVRSSVTTVLNSYREYANLQMQGAAPGDAAGAASTLDLRRNELEQALEVLRRYV